MRALVDTNILLDVLLPREPWAAAGKGVWDAADAGKFDASISALSLPNIFYIARKIVGLEKARETMTLLLDAFEIIPLTRETLEAAVHLPGNDFEDNLQLASALACKADVVITRDPRGFTNSTCPAITPEDFLAMLANAHP
jgi:predicted nucleic acid-binding protein